MSYTLTWSDVSKGIIVVDPRQIDTTSTSLTLYGKGAPNYGQGQHDNFLRLLENFASPTAPVHPTHGQIWFNTTDRYTYVFDTNDTWKKISGSVSVVESATEPTDHDLGLLWYQTPVNILWIWNGSGWDRVNKEIFGAAWIEEYNEAVDIYNQIAGAPTGNLGGGCAQAYGYGQTPLAHKTAYMTNQDWIDLLNRFKAVMQHQGINFANLSTRGFLYDGDGRILCGMAKLNEEWATTKAVLPTITNDRYAVNPLSLESSNAGGHVAVTGAWASSRQHDVMLTFRDADHLKAFFNCGGKIQLSYDFVPGASPSANDVGYAQLIDSIGTISVSACSTSTSTSTNNTRIPTTTGFYGMSATPQKYFEAFILDQPTSDGISVSMSIENGKDIRVITTFILATGGIYGAYSGQIAGEMISDMTLVKTSSAYLNTPTMDYPTVTATSTL